MIKQLNTQTALTLGRPIWMVRDMVLEHLSSRLELHMKESTLEVSTRAKV